MRNRTNLILVALAATFGCARKDTATKTDSATAAATSQPAACSGDNGGLTLPAGFCATIFADSIGHARPVVVDANGTVYGNTWSGAYYQGPLHEGGFLVAMRDTNKDRKTDSVVAFGR